MTAKCVAPGPESLLADLHVPFVPVDVDIAAIERRLSERNQARAEALLPDAIERYALAMKRGAVFPPIIVKRYGATGHSFVVLSGNNRVAAARDAGLKSLPGLLVAADLSVDLERQVKYLDNTMHGVPTSKDERTQHALSLIGLGMTMEDAAQRLGVSVHTVQTEYKFRAGLLRAGGLAVGTTARKMSKTTVGLLNVIKDDNVFRDAVRTVHARGIPSDQCAKLVRELNRAPAKAQDILEVAMPASAGVQSARIQPFSSVSRLRLSIDGVNSISEELVLESLLGIGQEERDQLASKLDLALAKLTIFRGLLA